MTDWTETPYEYAPRARGRGARNVFFQAIPGAIVFGLGAWLAAWMLNSRSGDTSFALDQAPVASTKRASAALADAAPANHATPVRSASLLDPSYSLGPAPAFFSLSAPLRASFEPIVRRNAMAAAQPAKALPQLPAASDFAAAAAPMPVPRQTASNDAAPQEAMDAAAPMPVPRMTGPEAIASLEAPRAAAPADGEATEAPMPAPRPPELKALNNRILGRPAVRQTASLPNRTAVPQTQAADNRSIFDKLFGRRDPAGPALAYASAEDGSGGNPRPPMMSAPMTTASGGTAIYDISAHTVYMPDGTRLEAHSGLGDRLDDPRHVHERMRGATPPHVYDLTLREKMFHGVQALRLNPVGEGNIYGRTGLLAHTFMLGPNGDSNGCVSFRNYNAFLQAYSRGEVRRLVVVANR